MRFMCDSTVGKLTKYLRILGFDTISIKDCGIQNHYKKSADPPLLLTKKRKLTAYQPVIIIQTNKVEEQIKEIESIIKPSIDSSRFMTRCVKCNTLLEHVDKEDAEARVPEYIYHHHEEFRMCPSCEKIYWQGTHAARMKKWTGILNKEK